MFSAIIIILFLLGGRAVFLYREAKSAGKDADYLHTCRICTGTFIPATLLLICEIAFYAVTYNDYNPPLVFKEELAAAFWTLILLGICWAVIRLPKDGWILRSILIAGTLTALLLAGIFIYYDRKEFSQAEKNRFHNNLKKCAGLIDQGKRKSLAEELPGVSGGTLRELNDSFEDMLGKMEAQK